MPRKPKRPCSFPGCPELVDGRFCEKHAKKVGQDYEKYGRPYKSSERYGKEWRKIRSRFIAIHPLCQDCLEYGITPVRKSEEVHHIKPLAEGGTNDFSNLRALCKICHSKRTVKENNRWGRTKNKSQ
ncbi:MAG: HNH endonuclease [Ruminococcus sp.]|nr:HNH endonuclease [Ruminococcus sp.]